MKDIKKNTLVEDVFDLDWDEKLHCARCDDELEEEDGIQVNGELYCEYCYKNYFSVCPECGKEFCHDDEGYYGPDEDEPWYCNKCWEKLFFQCESCSEVLPKEEAELGEDGEYYCHSCASGETLICAYCNHAIEDGDEVEVHGEYYCSYCFEGALGGFICANCGAECTEEDGEEGEDGEYYCYDCLEEIEEE